jgi:hypothetical protein
MISLKDIAIDFLNKNNYNQNWCITKRLITGIKGSLKNVISTQH